MAESEGGIAALLTQKLLLKLGPVLKLEKALKDLIARNNDWNLVFPFVLDLSCFYGDRAPLGMQKSTETIFLKLLLISQDLVTFHIFHLSF